jgi:hypothetical protein
MCGFAGELAAAGPADPGEEMAELLESAHRCDDDVSRAFVADHFARSGAATALDRALRLDTQIMLVNEPVKRVDNMTMAWGLGGSKLWQVGLLELWLQTHAVGGG